VISSSQKPLPDNTQHSQQTDIHAPVGFEPTISAGEWPKTNASDRAANATNVKLSNTHTQKEFYLKVKISTNGKTVCQATMTAEMEINHGSRHA
jgi:hypothetical protein